MSSRELRAVVFSHLPFEDLGTLEPRLLERGFQIHTVDVTTARFPLPQAAACDLLIVLGGPIGVYDAPTYPFLTAELDCIARRIAAQKPTLGICLGAQLMAAAMGARVYPGDQGPEIGWSPIHPPADAASPQWFKPLFHSGLHLFHWHGDTFDMPPHATRLQRRNSIAIRRFRWETSRCPCSFIPKWRPKAWSAGTWATPVNSARGNIGVPELRAAAVRHAPALAEAAYQFWNGWLDSLFA